MRALSERQAQTCEHAKNPRCRCRCGGAAHGTARGSGREFFEALDQEDPHYLPDEAVKRQRRLEARGQKRLPVDSTMEVR